MTTVHESLVCLRKVVDRLDEILIPWGFHFHPGETDYGSAGEYANGYYNRGPIRILLVWRARSGLGCVSYEHEEVLQQGYLREQIIWGMGHPGYMRIVGHADDCHLVENGISSRARCGGDPVEALAHDLREYATPTLSKDCDEFVSILRMGYRRRDVL